jgi:hypothetical protein
MMVVDCDDGTKFGWIKDEARRKREGKVVETNETNRDHLGPNRNQPPRVMDEDKKLIVYGRYMEDKVYGERILCFEEWR